MDVETATRALLESNPRTDLLILDAGQRGRRDRRVVDRAGPRFDPHERDGDDEDEEDDDDDDDEDDEEDDDDQDEWEDLCFPRFVEAVEGHPHVQGLLLSRFRFGAQAVSGERHGGGRGAGAGAGAGIGLVVVRRRHRHRRRPARAAAQRFFGSVLPRHPSLATLDLKDCHVEPSLLRAFFGAIPPANELRCFSLSSSSSGSDALDPECLDIVAHSLRDGVQIQELWVCCDQLDSDHHRRICAAAASNPSVQLLSVRRTGDGWVGDLVTVDDVRNLLRGGGGGGGGGGASSASASSSSSSSSSSLRSLWLHDNPGGRRGLDGVTSGAAWAPTLFRDVARLLRTNTTLEFLHLDNVVEEPSPEDMEFLLEVLRTYNFTLLGVTLRVDRYE